MTTKPNVLFVFPDQHRPDWVGFEGDVPVRTPAVDALSERGVAFRNAVTRSTPALLSPRFRRSVGTLVLRRKGGILSLNQDNITPNIIVRNLFSHVTLETAQSWFNALAVYHNARQN